MLPESKKDIHVLVVDDEAGIRDFLSMELAGQGYQISTAHNGTEAMEKIKKDHFRLVISDVRMPKVDGIQVLEAIKKIDPDTEVIMMTAYGDVEVAIKAMKKGAYDFVQKPFNLEEMVALIEKALEKSELKAHVALYESSKVIFSTLKLEAVLEVIIDMIKKTMRADEGSLMLVDKEKKLYIATSRGIDAEIARQVHLAMGERVAGRAASERKPFLLTGELKNYPEFEGVQSNPRIHSSIVCPLLYENEVLGVLNMSRTETQDDFTHSDLRIAMIFTSLVCQAVKNAQLYRSLEEKIEEINHAHQLLKDTQQQLIESEKLASLGRLMSGVAHEINNPMTAVMGYTQMLMDSGIEGDARENLSIVLQEANRVRKIVHDLLVFARHQKPQRTQVHLGELLKEALNVLALELKAREIEVSCESFEPRFPPVEADPGQITQVLLNVLSNAYQALQHVEGKRKIEITASVVEDNKRLRVVISDNGPGIPKENLTRIFEPFFTTKDVGKGTGLGLSICYGIMKEHGGTICVESKTGKGATFIIELPVFEPGASLPAGKKRILIVEDQPAIVRLIQKILEPRNYELDSASDGITALEKIRAKRYDLILSDYLIPRMSGKALFKEAQKLNPDLSAHFLLMTGSAVFGEDIAEFLKENKLVCLNKPFTADNLLEAIDKKFHEGNTP
ncbi:MAG: response regulator [Candidatus Omnitrophica bacterium]|nr:response regulator [Candidatus Omnitrophota bacterium]